MVHMPHDRGCIPAICRMTGVASLSYSEWRDRGALPGPAARSPAPEHPSVPCSFRPLFTRPCFSKTAAKSRPTHARLSRRKASCRWAGRLPSNVGQALTARCLGKGAGRHGTSSTQTASTSKRRCMPSASASARGFAICADEFLEDGIPRVQMMLDL